MSSSRVKKSSGIGAEKLTAKNLTAFIRSRARGDVLRQFSSKITKRGDLEKFITNKMGINLKNVSMNSEPVAVRVITRAPTAKAVAKASVSSSSDSDSESNLDMRFARSSAIHGVHIKPNSKHPRVSSRRALTTVSWGAFNKLPLSMRQGALNRLAKQEAAREREKDMEEKERGSRRKRNNINSNNVARFEKLWAGNGSSSNRSSGGKTPSSGNGSGSNVSRENWANMVNNGSNNGGHKQQAPTKGWARNENVVGLGDVSRFSMIERKKPSQFTQRIEHKPERSRHQLSYTQYKGLGKGELASIPTRPNMSLKSGRVLGSIRNLFGKYIRSKGMQTKNKPRRRARVVESSSDFTTDSSESNNTRTKKIRSSMMKMLYSSKLSTLKKLTPKKLRAQLAKKYDYSSSNMNMSKNQVNNDIRRYMNKKSAPLANRPITNQMVHSSLMSMLYYIKMANLRRKTMQEIRANLSNKMGGINLTPWRGKIKRNVEAYMMTEHPSRETMGKVQAILRRRRPKRNFAVPMVISRKPVQLVTSE